MTWTPAGHHDQGELYLHTRQGEKPIPGITLLQPRRTYTYQINVGPKNKGKRFQLLFVPSSAYSRLQAPLSTFSSLTVLSIQSQTSTVDLNGFARFKFKYRRDKDITIGTLVRLGASDPGVNNESGGHGGLLVRG